MLDVKTRAAGAALMVRLAPGPSVLVISFSDYVVSQACAHGLNAGSINGVLPTILRDLAPSDAYLCRSMIAGPGTLDELTGRELAVANVGIVDDPEIAMALARRGVWALTTDNLEDVRLVVGRTGSP